ncbi:uncharacterized protein LOC128224521 [Mya arenaria]|uniref:uncharacterized protein LOC128224521 n=1 Tax=Mya arenaria TaxID=6604 RepID=UPI0022E5330E|nr:uncharacterized protein LOC128224521 [Mya arenaria]
MNYYEQFYDDLEFEEDPNYRGNRHWGDPYYDEPYYDEMDRHYGSPRNRGRRRGQHYPGDPYERGPRMGHLVDDPQALQEMGPQFQGVEPGPSEQCHNRGQFGGRDFHEWNVEHDNQRGQRGRGRGRGNNNQFEKGPGLNSGGRGGNMTRCSRGKGLARGRGHKRSGILGLNFVKEGESLSGSNSGMNKATENINLDKHKGNDAKQESGGSSDTIRFNYKAYQNKQTDTEKEVEQALKAYRVQLGHGYGYGTRSDLIDGTPEATWVNLEEPEMVPMAEQCEILVAKSEHCKDTKKAAIIEPPKNAVKTAIVKTGFNFVKAKAEFKSTDVAFHETVEVKPKPNMLSVNMGNKRVGLGFGVSTSSLSNPSTDISEQFHAGMKGGRNAVFDSKFASLQQAVKLKYQPNNNGIETLHMAIQKVKIDFTDDIRPHGRTASGQTLFMCKLEIAGVNIAQGQATQKKAAKHEAYKNAVELFLKDNLTVKENSKGVFELKEKGTDSVFKIPAGPHLIPPTPIMQAHQTQSKHNTQSIAGNQSTFVKSSQKPGATNNKPGISQAHSQVDKTASFASSIPVKPKIVFHKANHPLSDKSLQFKKPGTPVSQTVQHAEALADQLLNIARESDNDAEKQKQDKSRSIAKEIDKGKIVIATANRIGASNVNKNTSVQVRSPEINVELANTQFKSEDDISAIQQESVKPSFPVQKVIVNKGDAAKPTVVKPHTGPIPSFMPRQTFVKPNDGQKPEEENQTEENSVIDKDKVAPSCESTAESSGKKKFPMQSFVKSSNESNILDNTARSEDHKCKQGIDASVGKGSDRTETLIKRQTFVKGSEEGHCTLPTVSFKPYLLNPPPKYNTGGRLQSIVSVVSQGNKNVTRKRPIDSPLTSGPKLKTRKVGNSFMHELDDLSQFIIIDSGLTNDLSILHNSANFNKVVLKVEYEPTSNGSNCSFIVSGHAVATAHGVTKEEAKNNAAKATLDELREMCYTIKVKQSVDSDAGGLTKEQLMSDIEQGTEMLPDSNVGNMLLRKMGWVGGGVGKKGQGQAEPVKAEMVIGRQGLGLKASRGIGKEFNRKVSTMLEDYLKNDEQKDLHFSSELSKEERATIHQIGQKMGLKTNSKGKGDNRYLIVSRKRSAHELLEHVIGSGGSTSKYEVIPPGNGDNDFRRREDIVYGQGKQ